MIKSMLKLSLLLLFISMISACGKENLDSNEIQINEIASSTINFDYTENVSWCTEDLYIFPMVKNSIVKLTAVEINQREIVWEINFRGEYEDLYFAELLDETYLPFYNDGNLSILNINSLSWIHIDEENLFPDYVSSDLGYTYFDGKFYGTLKGEDNYTAIYSVHGSSQALNLEFEYRSDQTNSILSTLVKESDSELKYVILNEEMQDDDGNLILKLIQILDGEVLNKLDIGKIPDCLYCKNLELLLYKEYIVIYGFRNVIIINKNDGRVLSAREFTTSFNGLNTKIIEGELFVENGVYQLDVYDFNSKSWRLIEGEEPGILGDIQINEDYLSYGYPDVGYSDDDYVFTSNFRLYHRENEADVAVSKILDNEFSSPKYIESLDQYIYHTDSRIVWFEMELE